MLSTIDTLPDAHCAINSSLDSHLIFDTNTVCNVCVLDLFLFLITGMESTCCNLTE